MNIYVVLAGVTVLTLVWIWLVWLMFSGNGINLKNILLAAFSGIIIFYPLWKKYLQPIIEQRKKL